MENNHRPLNIIEKKSLDQWAVTVFMPILEAISFLTLNLERLLEDID